MQKLENFDIQNVKYISKIIIFYSRMYINFRIYFDI